MSRRSMPQRPVHAHSNAGEPIGPRWSNRRWARRWFRTISTVVIASMLWSTVQPWNFIAPAAASTHPSPSSLPDQDRAANALLGEFAATFEAIAITAREVAAKVGTGVDASAARESLRAKRAKIGRMSWLLQRQFRRQLARLRSLELPPEIMARQYEADAKFKAYYTKAVAAIDTLLAPSASASALDAALATLNEAAEDRRHNALDPEQLPHRASPPQRPTTLRANAPGDTEASESAGHSAQTARALASAQQAVPTAADLAPTLDAPLSDGIRTLSATLGNDPLRIYNWVRANIRFVPTYGSIQGAEACRLSGECNAHDTASLLVAMLRAAGVPSRYVSGRVALAPDFFRSAMGDFADLNSAGRLASSGGIGVTMVSDGSGAVTSVRMDHVWVEAFVDYHPSRGATQSGANPDRWVALDAALKRTKFTAPLDVGATSAEDLDGIIDEFKTGVTLGPGGNSGTSLSTDAVQARLETVRAGFKTEIATNHDEATVGEVIGALENDVAALGALPASLPGDILSQSSPTPALSDAVRHKLTVEIQSGAFGLFSTSARATRPTVDLAGKRLTIGYNPATDTDQRTLDAFGGLLKTPPYLVSLKPFIFLDGEVLTTGRAVRMGSAERVKVSFTEPSGRTESVVHNINAGTYAAVALDLQRVSEAAARTRTQRFEQLKADLDFGSLPPGAVADHTVPWDDVIGEALHLHGQSYFLQVEAGNRMAAHQLDVVATKRPAEGLVTYGPTFAFAFGSARNISDVGMNIDVRRYVVSAASRSGNREAERTYLVTTGTFGSAAEHLVFEHLQQAESVSAVKLIGEANRRGIPVFFVDRTNIDEVLPQLRVATSVKNDVRNAAFAGKQILVPRDTLQFHNWRGVGYIVTDPVTGAAGYLISGGLAGGGTAEGSDFMDSIGNLIGFLAGLANVGGIAAALKASSNFFTGPNAVANLGKLAGAVSVIGNVIIGLSALFTGYATYEQTGSGWKGLGAGLIDLTVSILVYFAVNAIVAAIPVGAGLLGFLGAFIAIAIISILAFLLVGWLVSLIAGWIRMLPRVRGLAFEVISPLIERGFAHLSHALQPEWGNGPPGAPALA